MRHRAWLAPSLLLVVLLPLSSHAGPAAPAAEAFLVPLGVAKPKEMPRWHHVLPQGITAAETPVAWKTKVEKTRLVLFDVDGNGRVDDVGVDAWLLPEVTERYAVPFEGTLVLGAAVYRAVHVPETKRLQLARRAPSEDAVARRAVARLNGLRMAHGLCPVVLDPALSSDMAKHLRYMLIHGITHDEEPDKRRYTEAGARAGRRSVLSNLDDGSAVEEVPGWWRTFYHRTWPAHPDLRRIGWAHNSTYVGMEVLSGIVARPWRLPVRVPAPDTTVVSVAFNEGGERPRPYPGDEVVGFPITVYLGRDAPAPTDVKAALRRKGPKGKDVPFWISWPGSPASERREGNNDTITLIPHAPLAHRTTYWVRVRYRQGEDTHDLVWTFRTPKPIKR